MSQDRIRRSTPPARSARYILLRPIREPAPRESAALVRSQIPPAFLLAATALPESGSRWHAGRALHTPSPTAPPDSEYGCDSPSPPAPPTTRSWHRSSAYARLCSIVGCSPVPMPVSSFSLDHPWIAQQLVVLIHDWHWPLKLR